ncbi:MAG: glycosyltransferase family 4 protein [bacterium]|nr:glycosyltransferase family 4 protein [bacterium]
MDTKINPFQASPPLHKKRILFVITQSEIGGAQQFILQFIRHTKKDAYDISVAVGADGDGSFSRALLEFGVPVFVLSTLKRNISPIYDIVAVGQIKKLIQKLKPDTLFLGSSKAGFIGSLAAKFINYHLPIANDLSVNNQPMVKDKWKKINVIYRIGGWTFNDPWPTWKKALWRTLEKISASWKDIIIVNNNYDLIKAKEIGIKPRQDIVLIHNGLDPYKLDLLERDEARSQLGLPPSKKVIGTIANFYPTKGLEYLIEAATKINREDIVWCVIGDGEERHTLNKLIEENGLTEKVLLVGRKEQASRYLNAFDVFLLPSVKEGFPWVILEAMGAKLPIIATNVGAIPEIIENGVNGYIIDPRNSNQISEHVTMFLDNESRAKEMGIQAHQRLLFAFNIEATILKIEKLL